MISSGEAGQLWRGIGITQMKRLGGLQGVFLSPWDLITRKGLASPCLHGWKLTGLFTGLSHTMAPQLENGLEGNQWDFLISSHFLEVVVKGVLGRESLGNAITGYKYLWGHLTLPYLISVISGGAPAVHPEPLGNALFVNMILKNIFKNSFEMILVFPHCWVLRELWAAHRAGSG